MTPTPADHLSDDERARLAPYVTDLDGPVFALTNLPEVVKGALFARYSRSPKSLRRLLLDEFLPEGGDPHPAAAAEAVGSQRADALYGRVLAEYGDDSVAQLGAAHLAVEGASNVLTKVLEWGRLASYLEQSTRYISFAERVDGRFRYHEPAELAAHAELAGRYRAVLDDSFLVYGALIPRMTEHVDRHMPPTDAGDEAARARAVRAGALDLLRGLLPAATTANVGVFASGQAFEAMLVRMAAHPLAEARECAERMLVQLRSVIPAFLTRVDRPDRGVAQGAYMTESDRRAAEMAAEVSVARPAETPVGAPARLRPRRRVAGAGPGRVALLRRTPGRGAFVGGWPGVRRARAPSAPMGGRAHGPALAARTGAGEHQLHVRDRLRLRRLP
ncbi:MAG: FAD-dependent thymidylate synthase [Miltoncostaeaceae bacterium]